MENEVHKIGAQGCSTRPLLAEEAPGRYSSKCKEYITDGRKCYDWRAPAIILGFVCLESLTFYGISTNLVIFLTDNIHESNTAVASTVTNWTGTCYFTPFIGALLADAYLGNHKTIIFSSIIYILVFHLKLSFLIIFLGEKNIFYKNIRFKLLSNISYSPIFLQGTLIVTLSATCQPSESSCQGCLSAIKTQNLMLFTVLYLIAFGSGGVKSSLLPLGAEQFDDDPIGREKKDSFFSWFYFCIYVGALLSSTVIVWIQENISWSIGYGIAALCIALALAIYLIGTPIFRLRKSEGSPLKSISQVLVASLLKLNNTPRDTNQLHEIQGSYNLAHTDGFRFLDKAATLSSIEAENSSSHSPWRLCTVTQVEELKILLRLFPIWLTNTLYSIAYAQMYSTFIEQGRIMDVKIGFIIVPPASLLAFQVLSIMICVLLYNKIVVVAARSYLGNTHGLTNLQRMGAGQFLMILTMAIAAIVESRRLKSAAEGKAISILWQLPQYFMVSCSEVLCYIGQLEFFYDQGPDSMRSISTAISLLAISLGNYLNSLVIMVVKMATTRGNSRGWIPDDLNEGHLDFFFWLLTGICLLNCMAYIVCARRYVSKRVVED